MHVDRVRNDGDRNALWWGRGLSECRVLMRLVAGSHIHGIRVCI